MRDVTALTRVVMAVASCSAAVVVGGCGGTEHSGDRAALSSATTATRPVQTPFLQMNDTTTAPPGVHQSHAGVAACKTCHLVGGAVQFDPRGPAIIPGTLATDASGNVILDAQGNATILKPNQLPSYDTTTGSCSNVACHWVRPGIYTPRFSWWDTNTYAYGSTLPFQTPDWLSTPGAACSACHGYPPSSSGGPWHSTWHASVNVASTLNPDVLGFNACSTCHLDVHSTLLNPGTATGAIITTISTPSMHANGTVDVAWNPGGMGIPPFFCENCHFSF